jgi:hypothetical protein
MRRDKDSTRGLQAAHHIPSGGRIIVLWPIVECLEPLALAWLRRGLGGDETLEALHGLLALEQPLLDGGGIEDTYLWL